ncbi:MAG: hypothetical protein H6706_22455 [Myxococcales bacterium]|nr:hypothetical protein [Myxococcales bacterium]
MKRLVALLSLSALAASPALAAPRWGDFKDNGCVDRVAAPAMRALAAVLWDVDGSWEAACARTPATLRGVQLAHPQVCVNVAPAINPEALWSALRKGTALVGQCLKVTKVPPKDCWNLVVKDTTAIADDVNGPASAVLRQSLIQGWPGALFGAAPAGNAWRTQIAAAVQKKGVIQVKQGGGGLNIWGVFTVPDASCLPPAYHAAKGATWQAAADKCAEHGMKLCKRGALCQGGKPLAGSPAGDVWVATGDGPNTWISVGQAQPARTCKSHVEVAGSPPAWGTQSGPFPITGQPTMYRCCP